MGDAFVMPRGGESLPQLLRGLAAVADRDVQRRHMQAIVTRAELDLSPAAAWLLMRIEADGRADPAALAASYRLDVTRLLAGLDELRSRGLVVEQQHDGPSPPRRVLTPDGCDALSRLVDARRARLAELFAEWHPERREAIEELIGRLGRELVPDAPSAPTASAPARKARGRVSSCPPPGRPAPDITPPLPTVAPENMFIRPPTVSTQRNHAASRRLSVISLPEPRATTSRSSGQTSSRSTPSTSSAAT
jgi:DNA-binding MarR family transcriptional regulator